MQIFFPYSSEALLGFRCSHFLSPVLAWIYLPWISFFISPSFLGSPGKFMPVPDICPSNFLWYKQGKIIHLHCILAKSASGIVNYSGLFFFFENLSLLQWPLASHVFKNKNYHFFYLLLQFPITFYWFTLLLHLHTFAFSILSDISTCFFFYPVLKLIALNLEVPSNLSLTFLWSYQ